MEWWQILLLIFSILITVFLFAVFLDIAMVITFSQKLERRVKALSIILTEKKQLICLCYKDLESYSGKLSEIDESLYKKTLALNTESLEAEQINETEKTLRDAWARLDFAFEKQGRDPKQQEIVENYRDLNANYRQCTASYNYDVTGYNYWIKVPLASFLPWVLGYRRKEKLN